jgi:hypothetical protein
MLRLWMGGFAIGSVFGSALTLLVLVVIWLAEPQHLQELDRYPVDPNKEAIPAPPDSVPLDGPAPSQSTP